MTNKAAFERLQSKSGLTTAQTITTQEISNMRRCLDALNGKIPVTPEIQAQIDLLDSEAMQEHGVLFAEYIKQRRAWFNENY